MLGRRWRAIAAGLDAGMASRAFKPIVFVLCLIPALWLSWGLYQAITGRDPMLLGADPVIETLHRTGRDAVILLLLTLAVTPVRRLLKINGVQRVRRMLGVWSFTYACLHLATYLIFQQLCYSLETCEVSAIVEDVLKRPFIFMGMLTFTLLLPVAVTSTNGWVRRLGKRWQTIHRLSYVAAVTALIHFAWGQKSDIRQPIHWSLILGGLFLVRIYLSIQKRRARAQRAAVPAASPRALGKS